MSGGLDGSDWWQASDGRWYPPETRPPEPTGAPEPDPAAGASIGPLASSLMAGGAQFTNAPFEPTAAAPATAPSGTPSTKAEQKINFDADGWITLEEPRIAAPPPAPPSGVKAKLGPAVAIAVAVLVVGAAAVAFIPRGASRPVDAATDATETTAAPTDDGASEVDPLTLDSVLTDINVRYADVGHGYEKVVDGAVDPIGGEGCAQPGRPFADVIGTHWTAYSFVPDGNAGFPLGHLASVVTVYPTTPEANKRMEHEKTPAYAECLTRWSRSVWGATTALPPTDEIMMPLDAKVPGATSAAYRYGQTVEVEGRQYPLYTDIIVFTRGRLRVWIEVSSAFEPFDPARRDLMISRLLDRVNEAIK